MSAALNGHRTGRTIDEVAHAVAGLPDTKFLAAVELLTSGNEQPFIVGLLSRVRHRMRDLRPVRAPSLKRLFCRPFEDLLVSGARNGECPERIPRSAVAPVWRVIERRNRARFESLDIELKLLSAYDPQRTYAVAERLWRIAGATLAAETPLSLDAPDVVPLMRQSLAVALEIEAFKHAQPQNPLASLDAAAERDILAGIRMLNARNHPPDAFLRAVAARMAWPDELTPMLRAAGVEFQAAAALPAA